MFSLSKHYGIHDIRAGRRFLDAGTEVLASFFIDMLIIRDRVHQDQRNLIKPLIHAQILSCDLTELAIDKNSIKDCVMVC